MKKRLIISSLIALTVTSIGLYFYISGNNINKVVLENKETPDLFNLNSLTMMYETEAESGEYQV